jgi:hypothetical protein
VSRVRDRLVALASDREGGQIMILTLGLAMVVLALVFVVASVTAVQIERKQLLAVADAAALHAATRLDEAAYFARGDGDVWLTDDGVRSAVEDYLGDHAAALGVPRAAVANPTGTPDGRSAQVTLTTVADVPLIPWVLESVAGGVRLQVTTMARAG